MPVVSGFITSCKEDLSVKCHLAVTNSTHGLVFPLQEEMKLLVFLPAKQISH